VERGGIRARAYKRRLYNTRKTDGKAVSDGRVPMYEVTGTDRHKMKKAVSLVSLLKMRYDIA